MVQRENSSRLAAKTMRYAADPFGTEVALSIGLRSAGLRAAGGDMNNPLTRGLVVGSLLKDFLFAVRLLRRQLTFTTSATITLALGIGASTAIFSVAESTLLKPLPFLRTPDQLAFALGVAGPERDVRGASYYEVLDWQRRNRTLDSVAIYEATSLSLGTEAGAERVEAEMVSASYFSMVGASTQLGRTFTAEEDAEPNVFPVVVLSDRMWRSRFAADPAIVGRTLTLNDRSFTVVGVLMPDFNGLSFESDLWFPAAMVQANGGPADLAARGNRWLSAPSRVSATESPWRRRRATSIVSPRS